jgi:hypothetical protein
LPTRGKASRGSAAGSKHQSSAAAEGEPEPCSAVRSAVLRQDGLATRVRLEGGRGRGAGGLVVARVRRLELHCAPVRRPRSGSYRKAELRFLRSLGSRPCPWLSMVVHGFPYRCGPSADQGIGSSGCRRHLPLGPGRPSPVAAWCSGGAGDHRADLADKGPCCDGESSALWIAASPRSELAGQPGMAGLGMQGGSPLVHQRFGRVRMRHRDLLRR